MVLTLLALAAQQATLTGIVRDSTGLEPVAFAEVRVSSIEQAARTATGVSDRFGAFVVADAPTGPVRVEASAFGYAQWSRDYDELPGAPVTILLRPAPIELDSLRVEAGGRRGDPISVSRDAFVVDAAQIRALPVVMETDVLRTIAMSPSASAPSDFVSVPFVRGGTSEGTPLMLDGVRLFNPFHLGGFMAAVNAEAVDHATLLPSSGPGAEHIGSISGAIEIVTRDGARDRHRVAGAVGLASSRLSVEGPIGGSASYLVDGRRTYIDLLTRVLKRLEAIPEHFPYSFHDLHAKVTKDFGGVRRLSVTGYMNSEGIRYEDSAGSNRVSFDWGNAAVAAHYRDRVGTRAFLDATVGHSRFVNDFLALEDLDRPPVDTVILGGGHMTEERADVRVTWHTASGTVTAGSQVIRFVGDHDYGWSKASGILDPLTLRGVQWRTGVFVNVNRPLGRSWSTRAGMRADHFPGLANTLSPFAELSYDGSWWTARISAARSHQAIASLRNEESIGASFLAYDLMAPVERGPVPRNTEVTAGWEGTRGASRLRLDAYARRMDHLRLHPLSDDPLWDTALGEPALRMLGSGTARGVEASWSWARGPLSTVGTYRWSRATRTVGEFTFVPRFHRAHEFELGTALETGSSTWSARFSLRSGQPVTPLLAVIPAGSHLSGEDRHSRGGVVLGGAYNAGRLPRYLRLDLGWRRGGEAARQGGRSVAPFVSVANLFSAPNVLVGEVRVTRRSNDESPVSVERSYLPQMPMLVFFGLEFRF